MNAEPRQRTMRLSEVLAWLPELSKYQLRKWEEAGLIKCVPRRSMKERKRYFTADIAELMGFGSAALKNERDRV